MTASLNQSIKWILSVWLKVTKDEEEEKAASLCVGIITKKRAGSHMYLTQSVASLLSRVKLNLQRKLLISVFDVNTHVNTASWREQQQELDRLEGLLEIVNFRSAAAKWSNLSLYPPKIKVSQAKKKPYILF